MCRYTIKWRDLSAHVLKKCTIGGKIKFFMGSLGDDDVTQDPQQQNQQVSLEKTKERLAAVGVQFVIKDTAIVFPMRKFQALGGEA